MSDYFDLESELKKLKPAEVSPELASRVERALEENPGAPVATAGILPRRRKIRVNWLALGLGLAAAAAVLLLARTNVDAPAHQPTLAAVTPAPTAAKAMLPNEYVPSDLTRVVYDRRDEGLVFARTSETPSRRVRVRAQETMQWQNPATGASLRVSYPSEEVVLVPISGQ